MSVVSFLRFARALPGLYPALAFAYAARVTVRGASMYATLRPGDRILFDALAYTEEAPQVGDIVLALHSARPGVRFIKRVAALPGEIAGDAVLPPGEYWLLGDNPDGSTDSRELGPFRREDITARAWLVYWPPDRAQRL